LRCRSGLADVPAPPGGGTAGEVRMIRHLIKLAWHRKRSNLLLLLEIAASFVVVFAVGVTGLYFWSNWRRPIGFDWTNVWSVWITDEQSGDAYGQQEEARLAGRLVEELRAIPGVVAAGAMDSPPYVDWTSISNLEVDGRIIEFMSSGATVGTEQVLKL